MQRINGRTHFRNGMRSGTTQNRVPSGVSVRPRPPVFHLTKFRFFCGIKRIVSLVLTTEHAILFVLHVSFNCVPEKIVLPTLLAFKE